MNDRSNIILLLLIVCHSLVFAQPVFKVIPLGVKGGTDESNLSSYMLAGEISNDYMGYQATDL